LPTRQQAYPSRDRQKSLVAAGKESWRPKFSLSICFEVINISQHVGLTRQTAPRVGQKEMKK
jgi:hypothetical protein